MFDDSDLVLARARRILRDHVLPAVHRDRHPLQVTAWRAPGEPVPVAEALTAARTPIATGDPWGAPWSTWWFELRGTVPERFVGHPVEVVIDLGFNDAKPGFQAEGLLHDADGVPLKGIHPRNRWWRVSDQARGDEPVHLHLEAAANPVVLDDTFRPTDLGAPDSRNGAPLHTFGRIDLAVFDAEMFALAMDFDVLLDLAEHLPHREARRHQVVAAVDDALAVLRVHDLPATAAAARRALAPVMAAPAAASAHRLTAVGHAHIDSAWLWPIRETVRKCARTVASVTNLTEQYPELVFSFSSAQQYVWLRDGYPALWRRVEEAVAEGRIEPVGGMWVEVDGVIPSGESMVRQLLLGQRFFEQQFGRRCDGLWLPDSFGYSAAFPQLARLAGARWFLTQKISWNDTNTFPHHTFWWQGIDGSRVFTHFPPADTYTAALTGQDVHRSARQFAEKARSGEALIPFGYGDGGGGPSREMIERGRRLADLDGSPRVSFGSAGEFFDRLHADYANHAPTWTGELYLELHRGTLTSQRAMKAGNQRCEALLRAAEFVHTLAATSGLAPWPAEQLRELWERVLLLQFHDILPGSSIDWVHREAREDYQRMTTELHDLIDRALTVLGGGLLNCGPFARRVVVGCGDQQRFVEVPALSVTTARPAPLPAERIAHPVEVDGSTVRNGLVTVQIAEDGSIAHLLDHHQNRQVLPEGMRGGQLRLHPDVPARWDAWDLEKADSRVFDHPDAAAAGSSAVVVEPARVVEVGPLRAVVEARVRVGASHLRHRTTLTADSARVDIEVDVDWQERETTLAWHLPVSVLAGHSSAAIQFGHLDRPTHENTGWEAARHEMVAHRWLHVGETGWGLALVNESSYGHAVRRAVTDSDEPVTLLRLTLLRGPSFPDPDADRGRHLLRFAIVPGADIPAAIRHGYEVALPVLGEASTSPATADATTARVTPFLDVDDPGCVIEAVKLAEDGSGDVVVRCYEALGGRRRVTLTAGFEVVAATETDLLEDPDGTGLDGRRALEGCLGNRVTLMLRPFQIVTVRLRPGHAKLDRSV